MTELVNNARNMFSFI